MRTETRDKAHLALRSLWEVADTALRTSIEVEEETLPSGTLMKKMETEKGATIVRLGDLLLVNATFEKHDDTQEEVRIMFPEDIRDLSESEVEIEWQNGQGSGVNTPPIKSYPEIARDLLALV
jgi:hypothetical protein